MVQVIQDDSRFDTRFGNRRELEGEVAGEYHLRPVDCVDSNLVRRAADVKSLLCS